MIQKPFTTHEEIRENAHRFALDAFKNHVVVEEAPGRWRCGEPGTFIFQFRVVASPGALLVYGDIGSLFLEPRSEGNPIPWLRGAIRSPEYVMEKAGEHGRAIKAFYPGIAERCLLDYVDGEKSDHPDVTGCSVEDRKEWEEAKAKRAEKAEPIREGWSLYSDDDGEAFFRACYEELDGDSEFAEEARYWCFEQLWCMEALRWFIEALDKAPQLFYLRTGYSGDCVVLWRKEDKGYTTRIDDAAVYTEEEAKKRVRPGVDELLSCSDAKVAIRRHVDSEHLPRPPAVPTTPSVGPA